LAYDVPGYAPRKKKKPGFRIPLPGGGSIPVPDVGDVPFPDVLQNATSANPQPNALDWRSLLESDPLYRQGLVDIGAGSAGDRARTLAGLRSALIRYGGKGLTGLAGKLGAGWEDLLDPTTVQAAGAGDTAGTSLVAQLAKAHAGRNLAIQDINAAKGILSSGQTGFELGEERQRHTIAESDAVTALLDFLSGLTGGYAGRESERNIAKGRLGSDTLDRLYQMGLEPAAPKPLDFGGILGKLAKPRAKTKRPRGRGFIE
jgi:hypothetical protein